MLCLKPVRLGEHKRQGLTAIRRKSFFHGATRVQRWAQRTIRPVRRRAWPPDGDGVALGRGFQQPHTARPRSAGGRPGSAASVAHARSSWLARCHERTPATAEGDEGFRGSGCGGGSEQTGATVSATVRLLDVLRRGLGLERHARHDLAGRRCRPTRLGLAGTNVFRVAVVSHGISVGGRCRTQGLHGSALRRRSWRPRRLGPVGSIPRRSAAARWRPARGPRPAPG